MKHVWMLSVQSDISMSVNLITKKFYFLHEILGLDAV